MNCADGDYLMQEKTDFDRQMQSVSIDLKVLHKNIIDRGTFKAIRKAKLLLDWHEG